MLVGKHEIAALIPQRPPIVMVDSLEEHEALFSVSSFHIMADNIFVEEGFLQMPGLVENIAQTCALRSGYEFRQKLSANPGTEMKPPVGFIGEVKNLELFQLPAVGNTLQTRIEILHTVFSASIIKGEIFVKDQCMASCEMKIFVAG
ncbi:MAG: 3-hydroxyacyl-ACP dehydratase [Chitinophagales bacterium]